jgi:hypothetical protein
MSVVIGLLILAGVIGSHGFLWWTAEAVPFGYSRLILVLGHTLLVQNSRCSYTFVGRYGSDVNNSPS